MASLDKAVSDVTEPPLPTGSDVSTVHSFVTTPHSLNSHFLARLSRLLHQESEWRNRVEADDWRLKLIHHAIYSTYRDCATNNIGDQARDLIRNRRYNQ
ncbi:MAG TPA: hypothetical protein VKT80_02065 [Chloroflexota bacterium]|nr:hypothetical protein [Chloroflexota bacterium]